jgi:hypothetical protein
MKTTRFPPTPCVKCGVLVWTWGHEKEPEKAEDILPSGRIVGLQPHVFRWLRLGKATQILLGHG